MKPNGIFGVQGVVQLVWYSKELLPRSFVERLGKVEQSLEEKQFSIRQWPIRRIREDIRSGQKGR